MNLVIISLDFIILSVSAKQLQFNYVNIFTNQNIDSEEILQNLKYQNFI